MRVKILQIEKSIRMLCGYVLFPLCLTVMMFKAGINEYNFTGLLNLRGYSAVMRCAAMIMLVWCIRTLWIIHHSIPGYLPMRTYILLLAVFAACTGAAVFIPYIEGTMYATMHLCAAYSAFVIFNILMTDVLCSTFSSRTFYLAGIFFAALLCFTAGQITGLAELVYACMVSILLTYQSK